MSSSFFSLMLLVLVLETSGHSYLLDPGTSRPKNALHEPSVISLISTSPASYVAQRAAFGDPMEGRVIRANLVVPPNDDVDSTLCSYPDSLKGFSKADSPYNNDSYTISVALFVSADGCSAEQKARVALEIQKNVSQSVKYIIIYGTNPEEDDALWELQPSDSSAFYELQTIGILYVPYTYAQALSSRIVERATTIQADPRYLQTDNRRWAFFIRIENESDTHPPFDNSDAMNRNSLGNPDSFYWVRFVLFTVLIVSPCFRAAYLWWAGGGRFCFRWNEQGRIVGIQYVP
jgi:hypothetical protein